MISQEERDHYVALSLLPGIGPVRFARLLERCGSAVNAWRAGTEDLRACGIDDKTIGQLLDKRVITDVARETERVRQSGARVITWLDDEYPSLLRETFNRPVVLYVKGTLLPEDERSIGIIGTRRPTDYGKTLAVRMAQELVEAGLTVVSGMARGIDTLAHRGTLHAGGRTIAVLGSGIDVLYPWENRSLAERIYENGAVVTEYPLGTQPDAFNFPARNRIISGLSLGTLIVEAGEKSGALRTANFAVDQNREVFVCPGRATDTQSLGCNRLIQQGQAKLVQSADEILNELNLAGVPTKQLAMDYSLVANETERRLLMLLSTEPRHIDDLGREAALRAPEITSTLSLLELRGVIRNVGGMHYVLA